MIGTCLEGVVIEDNKGGHKLAGPDKLRYSPVVTEIQINRQVVFNDG